jgi:hypothetical protein
MFIPSYIGAFAIDISHRFIFFVLDTPYLHFSIVASFLWIKLLSSTQL